MDLWQGILLMPALLIRCEPYIFSIKALGASYRQSITLTSTGTSLSVILWYIVIVVLPEHITLDKMEAGNKALIWHRKNEHKNRQRAEKIYNWLKVHKILFLFPLLLILMVSIPIPIPLPLPAVAIFLIKITDYSLKGLLIILAGNVIKVYILASLIYKVF
ncbi:MAG: hypothetical protein ABIH48_00545 [Candidatus Falkowbacteria bacterium]